jgi:hypothetical protein
VKRWYSRSPGARAGGVRLPTDRELRRHVPTAAVSSSTPPAYTRFSCAHSTLSGTIEPGTPPIPDLGRCRHEVVTSSHGALEFHQRGHLSLEILDAGHRARGPRDRAQRRYTGRRGQCLLDALASFGQFRQIGVHSAQSIIELLFSGQHPRLSGTIFCTHGELMRPFLQRLQAGRVEIDAERDGDEWLLLEGSIWRLMLDPYGHIAKPTHETPLPLPGCEAHATSD